MCHFPTKHFWWHRRLPATQHWITIKSHQIVVVPETGVPPVIIHVGLGFSRKLPSSGKGYPHDERLKPPITNMKSFFFHWCHPPAACVLRVGLSSPIYRSIMILPPINITTNHDDSSFFFISHVFRHFRHWYFTQKFIFWDKNPSKPSTPPPRRHVRNSLEAIGFPNSHRAAREVDGAKVVRSIWRTEKTSMLCWL